MVCLLWFRLAIIQGVHRAQSERDQGTARSPVLAISPISCTSHFSSARMSALRPGWGATHSCRRRGPASRAPLLRAHVSDPASDGLEIVLKGGQMGGEAFFGHVRDGGQAGLAAATMGQTYNARWSRRDTLPPGTAPRVRAPNS